jgi:hypothetical protein
MTDVSPEVQAKLRAQADQVRDDLYLGNCSHTERALCDDCATDKVVAYGRRCLALGVSSERARQQGLIQKWREREMKLCKRADTADHAGNALFARTCAGQAERIAECADELEAGQ